MSERDEQVAVVQYLDYMGLLYFHPANEAKRSYKLASMLKAEGLKAGVPDLVICEPVGKYHGLFIEMKFGKNKPTEAQKEWLDQLARRGYAVAICYTAESAIKVIENYLHMI